MASENALILRNAHARTRLNNAIDALRESGHDIPELVTTHRDVQVARAQELEYFASVLEGFAGIKEQAGSSELTTPAADAVAEEAAVEASETGKAVEDTDAAQSMARVELKPLQKARGKAGGATKNAKGTSGKARK